ncbi:hypothetical protein [Desulfuromonas sp.]|uniref:hypothetical protein n=1 Tax=Desulfuromonas sp. TaxID=892 RepID=UPI0025BDDA01|nr:hypothetical protein [Desulfuromonas sp.]
MKREELFSRPIGSSTGMGFFAIVGMIGLLTSFFILWSLSCLGGATFDLASRLI